MKYVRPYKIYEADTETANDVKYLKYIDRMNNADRRKMEATLDKPYNTWSNEDKEFMKKMSRKDVDLWVDPEGNRFTEEELKTKGVDVDRLTGKSSGNEKQSNEFDRDSSELFSTAKAFIMKYKNSKDLSKVDSALRNLTSEIEKLK